MPRTHGVGRGSRLHKGVFSATTVAVIPSGVTADQSGLTALIVGTTPSGCTLAEAGIQYAAAGTKISPAELGYLDGQAGYGVAYTSTVGYKVSGGTITWAGASTTITHGMTTTLQACVATYEWKSAVSSAIVMLGTNNVSTSAVSVAVYGEPADVSAALTPIASGGTIHWMALGK